MKRINYVEMNKCYESSAVFFLIYERFLNLYKL